MESKAMRDPYDILGVNKSATPQAIKSAYRKLAKKLHPDANKQDQKAASKFAELNAAYEILGDDDKRKAFDRGEIDAEGKPRFRGFEGFGPGGPGGEPGAGGFETFTWGPEGFQRAGGARRGGFRGVGGGFGGIDDILKEFMGGAAGRRRQQFETDDFGQGPGAGFGSAPGRDVTGAVTITLNEAAKGTSRRVQLPTGKGIDGEIPGGPADGPNSRPEGEGPGGT